MVESVINYRFAKLSGRTTQTIHNSVLVKRRHRPHNTKMLRVAPASIPFSLSLLFVIYCALLHPLPSAGDDDASAEWKSGRRHMIFGGHTATRNADASADASSLSPADERRCRCPAAVAYDADVVRATFKSPRYPQSYCGELNCTWLIEVRRLNEIT